MEFLDSRHLRASVERLSFLGAARGYVEDDGEDVIAMAFGSSLDDAELFGLSVCDAYDLRAALDRALARPRPAVVP